MQPALFDTSLYITAIRKGDEATLALRRISSGSPVWLSSVVLEELYAGAGERQSRMIERMERDFDGVRRILVPSLSDWALSGRVLAKLAAKHGFEAIGRGRLTNDALIAASAGRSGIRVLTANERDFRRLSEFCHFQWQLIEV